MHSGAPREGGAREHAIVAPRESIGVIGDGYPDLTGEPAKTNAAYAAIEDALYPSWRHTGAGRDHAGVGDIATGADSRLHRCRRGHLQREKQRNQHGRTLHRVTAGLQEHGGAGRPVPGTPSSPLVATFSQASSLPGVPKAGTPRGDSKEEEETLTAVEVVEARVHHAVEYRSKGVREPD